MLLNEFTEAHGIFEKLYAADNELMISVLGERDSDNIAILDEYLSFRYGGRILCSRCDSYYTNYGNDTAVAKIAALLITRYSKEWTSIADNENINWNILTPYLYTKTHEGSDTFDNTSNTQTQNKVYGYDSETGVNDNDSNQTETLGHEGSNSYTETIQHGIEKYTPIEVMNQKNEYAKLNRIVDIVCDDILDFISLDIF